ncbi:unnamed protein product [Phaedon cochleariae]|uniref:THAP-type domain-containing protein n=1 Tax=Phaedon cochleariae TaxID=80249 RepID=A0A9P0GMA8_PHACE|nr:unnamed protein product [Phaedon cochleariae]
MAVKYCFVPSCPNTSEKNKDKLFILVPLKENIRMKWCVAVSRPYTKTKRLYCCEDHFDLEFDMLNWMEYKLIGSRVYMRENVFPHKFVDSPKPTECSSKSQLSSSSRKRRSHSLENLGDKVKKEFIGFVTSSTEETSSIVSDPFSPREQLTTNQIESPSEKLLEILMNCQQSLTEGEGEFTPVMNYYYEPESTSKVKKKFGFVRSTEETKSIVSDQLSPRLTMN